MATTLQLKLRGIFLADDSPVILTKPVGDIFTNIISAVNSFFQRLIGLFNQEFPPETRDEQIRQWFDGKTPYVIAAVVLITCLCCWSCLLSCISAIFVGCFNIVRSLFRCVGWCFRPLFRCVRWVFCCGRRMRAPGRSPMMIRRAAFEANPRGYFLGLRGKPNNFVY